MPCFQEHALQLQLAVALYVRLVEPHGQVGQDEVAVSSVGQLSTNGVLQEELLLVCTGEPVGDLIKEGCGPCMKQKRSVTFFPVMVIF